MINLFRALSIFATLFEFDRRGYRLTVREGLGVVLIEGNTHETYILRPDKMDVIRLPPWRSSIYRPIEIR